MAKKTGLGLVLVLLLGFSVLWGCAGTDSGNESNSKGIGGEEMLPFNAMIGAGGPLAYKEEFLKTNRTYGVKYPNENWNPEDGSSPKGFIDLTSPKFRTFIITEKARLDEIFSVCPEIDFEKEMVVMYAFTSVYNGRDLKITSITLDNKNLKIEFKYVEGKPGHKDASSPQTRFFVIKMDKLDMDTVEFTLLNPSG